MFNLTGSEIVFLLLIALVVLGPEKLPDAVRRFGKTYGEFKKMTSGFQSELRSALDEPMKEMRETADAMRKAVNLDAFGDAPQNIEPQRVEPLTSPSTPATAVTAAEPDSTAKPLNFGSQAIVDAAVAVSPQQAQPSPMIPIISVIDPVSAADSSDARNASPPTSSPVLSSDGDGVAGE